MALADVTVLDFTHHVAGPYCTKLLADYGADVIKVERPDGGDGARRLGPFPNDEPHLEKGGMFLHLNTNKRSVALDLKTEEGQRMALDLVGRCDVVVESFRPGTMARFGLDYPRIRAVKPSLVMTSISNFGQTGPYRDYRGSDIVFYGMGGEMYSTGLEDREPLHIGANVLLYQAGAAAAVGTMGALAAARGQGVGQHVDVSIMETQLASIDRRMTALLAYQYTGEITRRVPMSSIGFPIGVYPCSDGYVTFMGGNVYFPRVVRMLGEPEFLLDPKWYEPDAQLNLDLKYEFEEYFIPWCMERTRAQVWQSAQEARVLSGPLNAIADLAGDRHFRERRVFTEIDHPEAGRLEYPGRPFVMSESPWSIRRPAPLLGQHDAEIFPTHTDAQKASSPRAGVSPAGIKAAPPLAGTRVLDMTLVWAGPYCTTFLADLGAEVIRVESTQTMVPMTRGLVARPTEEMLRSQLLIFGGLPGRTPGARPWNRAPLFNAHARNKRSMTADLMQPKGMEIFKRLVKISDVFVENNATSTMEKLGISYEMLRSERPDIIMVRMPAYGSSGPYASYRALGNHIEGVIGHSTVRGYPDMDPSTNTPVFVADAAAGAHAAFAVLAALNYRRRTGKGQLVELPLAESTLPYLGHFFMDYSMNGRSAGAIGNRHPYAVQGCYPCKGEDRWVCVTIFDDRDWTALCDIMGRPDLYRDSRFADQAGRYRNHDEIDRHIAEWTRLHDPREVMSVLQGDGLAAGPVMDQRDVFDDPHVIERGVFEEAYQEDTGTHWYTGAPYRMSETPCGVLRGPARLGEDNDYVYKELLRVGDAEYGELEYEGHVGMDYDESVP